MQKSNTLANGTETIISKVNTDFSNIDEVYNELKERWINNDIETSELEFIKCQILLIFSKNDVWNKDVENFDYNRKLKLHEYLQSKQTSVDWTDYDYYKHYLQTKRFGFNIFVPFHKRQFESITNRLATQEQQYYYIFNKLSENKKIEFKNDFCDNIQKVINVQTESKYKELLNDFSAVIDNHYAAFKKANPTPGFAPNKEPQQTKINKIVEVTETKKELHNNYFVSNAFEVFDKYHSQKNITESCRTELSLLFQLFKNDELLIDTIELKHYIKWLNKTYNYSLIELKKTNIKSKPNIQRTNDYKLYKEATLKKP